MEDLDKLIAELEETAAKETHEEANADYLPGDLSNFDDARAEGEHDADIEWSRTMLPLLKELRDRRSGKI